jgi:hypothetical protein
MVSDREVRLDLEGADGGVELYEGCGDPARGGVTYHVDLSLRAKGGGAWGRHAFEIAGGRGWCSCLRRGHGRWVTKSEATIRRLLRDVVFRIRLNVGMTLPNIALPYLAGQQVFGFFLGCLFAGFRTSDLGEGSAVDTGGLSAFKSEIGYCSS